MYLSNIKLWNFRRFGQAEAFDPKKPNLDLNLQNGLNVIIGENDSGKTAIIDAIKLVLKTHSYDYIRVDDKDFYSGSEYFRIELTFDGLTPQEAKNFTEWLGWIGDGDQAKPFLKLSFDGRRKDNKIYPADVKAGVDDEGYLLTAEAREYLKVTYLKPLRDAESELVAKRNSRLSQILLADEAFKGKEQTNDLVEIFSVLKVGLENYFKGEFEREISKPDGTKEVIKPDDGKKIKDKIDRYINDFYGAGTQTEFNATSNDIKSILEKLTLNLLGDPNPGLGTLNRLFMAAELLHLNKSNWSGLRLGLVEELEAHLHPQAQMQVIEALQKQENIQLILTTHSPNLASKLKLRNLIICNNSNAFPMGESFTKLAFDNYKFLEKFLDTTKANLFFAKGVILVEGWAEEILIPSLAKAVGINLTEKGVSVVNIGHTGFDHYANIYLRKSEPHMQIPVAVITDADVRCYEKNGDDFFKRDTEAIDEETKQKIEEIESKSEGCVKYFATPSWTLEYAMFNSKSLKTTFETAAKEIHTKTPWDSDFELELAKKLIKKSLEKTRIAYEIATAIDEDLKKPVHERQIKITDDDSISYLVSAIKYAAGN
ncbi:AAA family ATPase [Methylophilus sp. VKM B-3414]|uniref:ATP-dependent nuclease n=1 Tax=Methylophilus sp. VKM B-3414 TaxID=3076121 RepID=UPI0028C9D485|nr:AAA family ATPase [Methylophilus sp. VKM B-3414]MDT7849783.1 AAA family ATPase [Methylophilus sp. VKM B-3414]